MPKIVDHDRQRELILDACLPLFVDQGYAEATMRRLAQSAGVSTGTLYHYFADKQALLAAAFEQSLRRDVERVRGTLPEGASVPIRLRALFRWYAEEHAHLRDLLRLAFEVHRHEPSPESRRQVRDVVRRFRDAAATILGVEGQAADVAFTVLLGGVANGILDPEAVDLAGLEAFAQAVWARLGPEIGAASADLGGVEHP